MKMLPAFVLPGVRDALCADSPAGKAQEERGEGRAAGKGNPYGLPVRLQKDQLTTPTPKHHSICTHAASECVCTCVLPTQRICLCRTPGKTQARLHARENGIEVPQRYNVEERIGGAENQSEEEEIVFKCTDGQTCPEQGENIPSLAIAHGHTGANIHTEGVVRRTKAPRHKSNPS